MTVTRQLDVAEHVLRSMRGWVHSLVPGPAKYITRKQDPGAPSRPAFRLEIASGPLAMPQSQGFFIHEIAVSIRYQSSGLWDAHRVTSQLVNCATEPYGQVPFYLYNVPWPGVPRVHRASLTGGTLPASVDVGVAITDTDGNQSSFSEPLTVPIAGTETLAIQPNPWPYTGMATSYELYAAATGGVMTLQATWNAGDPPPELSSVSTGATVTTNRRLPWKGLRVTRVDADVLEQPDSEETFDSLITVRCEVSIPRVYDYGGDLTGPGIALSGAGSLGVS